MKGFIRFENPVSLDHAIEEAELDWSVESYGRVLVQKMDKDGNAIGEPIPAPGYQGIVKENGGKDVLAIMGSRYSPIQNRQGFDFLRELTETRELLVSGAGNLNGGRRVFVQTKLPESVVIGGLDSEKHDVFLTFATSHDGSLPFVIVAGLIRIVCQNTLRAAIREKNQFRIYHTGNGMNKVAQAREAIKMTWKYVNELQEVGSSLMNKSFSSEELKKMSAKLLGFVEGKKNKDGDLVDQTKILNQASQIVRLYEEKPDLQVSGVKGTKYAALNAITDYLDHEKTVRGTNDDEKNAKRFELSLFGTSANIRQEAVELLMK